MEFNLLTEQQEFLNKLGKQGKSFNTIKNYKADLQCFNNFLVTKQQNLKMKNFNVGQVHEYSHFLEEKYSSSNSIRRRVQALRLFFDFLMTKDLFQENPIKKMEVSPKVLDLPDPTFFPDIRSTYLFLKKRVAESEGISQLVHKRNVIIFHLIYGGGLKVSDLAKLEFSSIIKDQKHYRVMVEHPKRDPYSIPLPPVFNQDFLDYKKHYEEYLERESLEISELLFNANPYRILSGGLSPRGIELFFEELRKHLKTDITAKSLRQSCIFKWLNHHINHTTIKEWLGVTPSYSLELYLDELKKDSSRFVFMDLEES